MRVNEQIRVPEVRLVDHEGKQLGIKSTLEALALARRHQLDLVEVAAQAQPPVCKIMDYGKFKFQLAKKAKDNRKGQKNVVLKELKFGLKINEHDFDTKINHAIGFLEDGHRCKIIIMFRGREIQYKDRGFAMQKRLIEKLTPFGVIEKPGDVEGNNIILVVGPKPKPIEKAQAAPQASAEAAPGAPPAAAPENA